MKFGENLPRSFFQKSELGKFIPNFPLKHVITSTSQCSLFMPPEIGKNGSFLEYGNPSHGFGIFQEMLYESLP